MSDRTYGHGFPGGPPGWKKPLLTPAQWDEIRQRRDAGEAPAVLAHEYGIPTRTIYDRLGRRP